MVFIQHITGFDTWTILSLAFFASIAGFIDSVAGGGGLIQLPALLIKLPDTNLVTIFGTNKIAGFSGTSMATVRYARLIKFNYKLLFTISAFAAVGGFTGARVLNYIDANILKPYVLLALFIIAVYTLLKKDLGSVRTKYPNFKKQYIWGSTLGLIVGVYDGFFGPGTGSFLMLGFVLVLGFEFIEASAYAKFVNAITNVAALVVFIYHGNYILPIAIVMAVFNIIGSYIGSHLAIKKGNKFVRIVFMIIVFVMIIRYGYDIAKIYFQ